MLLSERIQLSLSNGKLNRVTLNVWLDQALDMETQANEWPKVGNSHPDTSYWDGDTTKLRENQLAVYQIFEFAKDPIDTVGLEDLYSEGFYRNLVPKQSGSGIRTRRKELERQGVIVKVDKDGTSPSGRPAWRYQIRSES